ncbi:MAG: hypothetical protein R6X07_10010 [Desulfatiglandales bacterium]|jgi:hypothetical protein
MALSPDKPNLDNLANLIWKSSERLVSTAEKDVLAGLILALAQKEPEVRRSCFEYLKKHAALPEEEQVEAEGEAMMALWMELEPDLSKLDEYGGGDRHTEDHVETLLYELAENSRRKRSPAITADSSSIR